MTDPRPFLVGGEWRSSEDILEVRFPYTNEVVGRVCQATEQDLEDAIRAAERGFEITRKLPAHARSRILYALLDRMQARRSELVETLILEGGKTRGVAEGETSRAMETVRVAAEEAKRVTGEIVPIDWTEAGEIARVLREGYDVGLLNDGFQRLIRTLKLDVLLIDTHPGMNEETLLSIAISDALAIILRPDQQDYQGTGVTVEVARRLSVPQMMLVVNKVPAVFAEGEVRARVEHAYQAEVAAVLPHSDEMMALASAGVFVTRYPDHAITATLEQVARRLA